MDLTDDHTISPKRLIADFIRTATPKSQSVSIRRQKRGTKRKSSISLADRRWSQTPSTETPKQLIKLAIGRLSDSGAPTSRMAGLHNKHSFQKPDEDLSDDANKPSTSGSFPRPAAIGRRARQVQWNKKLHSPFDANSFAAAVNRRLADEGESSDASTVEFKSVREPSAVDTVQNHGLNKMDERMPDVFPSTKDTEVLAEFMTTNFIPPRSSSKKMGSSSRSTPEKHLKRLDQSQDLASPRRTRKSPSFHEALPVTGTPSASSSEKNRSIQLDPLETHSFIPDLGSQLKDLSFRHSSVKRKRLLETDLESTPRTSFQRSSQPESSQPKYFQTTLMDHSNWSKLLRPVASSTPVVKDGDVFSSHEPGSLDSAQSRDTHKKSSRKSLLSDKRSKAGGSLQNLSMSSKTRHLSSKSDASRIVDSTQAKRREVADLSSFSKSEVRAKRIGSVSADEKLDQSILRDASIKNVPTAKKLNRSYPSRRTDHSDSEETVVRLQSSLSSGVSIAVDNIGLIPSSNDSTRREKHDSPPKTVDNKSSRDVSSSSRHLLLKDTSGVRGRTSASAEKTHSRRSWIPLVGKRESLPKRSETGSGLSSNLQGASRRPPSADPARESTDAETEDSLSDIELPPPTKRKQSNSGKKWKPAQRRDTVAGLLPTICAKKNFEHFSKKRIMRDTTEAVNSSTNAYFDTVAKHLDSVMARKRGHLDPGDVIDFLEECNLFDEPFENLVRKYYPVEYQEKLVPVAQAFNKINF